MNVIRNNYYETCITTNTRRVKTISYVGFFFSRKFIGIDGGKNIGYGVEMGGGGEEGK